MNYEIVREELQKIAKPMLPLAVFTYAGFALCGYYGWETILSILLGTLYALFQFYQIGKAAVRAAALYRDPSRAQKQVFSGYLTRYALTALLVVLAFKLPFLNPAAVIIPLFYTKVILLISNILRRKGG